MRNFKFRIWDKSRQKMCYTNPLEFLSVCSPMQNILPYCVHGQLHTPCDHRANGTEYDTSDKQFVNTDQSNFVIQQCIGAQDIHNKDIYEGDIISFKNHAGGKELIVEYIPDVCSDRLNPARFAIPSSKIMKEYYNMTIIGNIYEGITNDNKINQ